MNITHPDDRDRLRRLYDEVRAGLDDYAVEYRVRRRDGGVVWVREIAEVVRDADGRRVGVEGTMQDITDQRALEEQLRQAQKMESIGQLTGGIAHDFNNLMAVILGNLELLAEDLPGNAAAQQKIDTAIRSTLRGSDLTQRLLAFARQQSLAPKLTRIDDLIRAMRDLLLRPLGPAIEATFALGRRPLADGDRPGAPGDLAAEPGHQCARRHARRRQADRSRRATSRSSPAMPGRSKAWRPATTSSSPSATAARA